MLLLTSSISALNFEKVWTLIKAYTVNYEWPPDVSQTKTKKKKKVKRTEGSDEDTTPPYQCILRLNDMRLYYSTTR